MNKSRCAAALAVLSVSLVAQSKIIVVDAQNRAGTDFRDLPAAVAAAKNGDRLHVRAGSYTGFVTDKGIAVLGEPGSRINAVVRTGTAVRIANLGKNRSFRLSGFLLARSTSIIHAPRGVLFIAEDCRGSVHLERVVGQLGPTLERVPAARIARCDEATLAQCKFRGNPAVDVKLATFFATGTECIGTHGLAGHGEVDAGAGIRAERTHGVLSRCFVVGGNLILGISPRVRPQPGITSLSSTWTITGESGTSIRGGTGSPPASAIDGTGTVTLDPVVRLIPAKGAPPVGAGITLKRAGIPSLRALGAPLKGTVRLEILSRPKDIAVLFAGVLGPRIRLAGVGDLWLDPRRSFFVAAGTTDRAGRFGLGLRVPGDLGLFGARISWQGFAGTLLRGLRLSNPASYVHDQ